MMLGMIFVLAVAGSAFADDCCSAEDRKEIQFIWGKVWASSFTDRKVAIAGAVFNELFTVYPEAKKLFNRFNVEDPNSGEFRSHLVRVAGGVDNVVNLLDDPAVLSEQLKHLATFHKGIDGVRAVYLTGLADAFEKVLPQVSSCFNVEAWNRCFRQAVGIVAADLP
jgi:hemoglobin-like flavoprotein